MHRGALTWLSAVLQTESHNTVRWPQALWQQLDNRIRLGESVPDDVRAIAGVEREARRQRGDPWLALAAPPKGINDSSVTVKLSPLRPFVAEAGWQRNTLGILCCTALGDSVAVGGNDGSVRLLRADDLRPIAAVQAHSNRVTAVCSIADGARFASAGQDGAACIWDARTLSKLMTLDTGLGCVGSGAGAGSRFVTVGSDGTAIVWNAVSGEKVAVFSVKKSASSDYFPVALSSDGKFLAASDNDGQLSVWSVEDARCLAAVESRQGSGEACAFARGNSTVLSCGAGGKVVAWHWSSAGPPSTVASIGRHSLLCLSYDAVSDQIVFGDENGNLWSHQVSGEGEPRRITTHSGEVYSCCIGGDAVFSGSREGVIKRSLLIKPRASQGREVGHDTAVSCCATASEQGLMATGEGYALRGKHTWVPDARRPADKPLVKVWTKTGALACQLSGHSGKLTGCCFSRDGAYLITTDTEGQIIVWSVSLATQMMKSCIESYAHSPALNDSSRWLAVRSGNGQVLIFDLHASAIDLTDRGVIARLGVRDRKNFYLAHAFSPDRSILACASNSGHVELWSEPWREVAARSKTAEDAIFTSLAWSPDGAALVCGTENGSLVAFDSGALTCLNRFRAHWAAVTSCAFAARGEILLSASEEGSVRAWMWPGGTPVAVLPTQGVATCVAAGRDESGCAGDESGAVYLFRLVKGTA